MILETVCVGALEANCYIVAEGSNAEAIIIDPGAEEDKIRQAMAKHRLEPALIINTHGHFDHIGCDDKFAVPVYIHRDDAGMLKDPQRNFSDFLMSPYSLKSGVIKILQDKDVVSLGKIELEVIHTPGHTAGGICLLLKKPGNKALFSGDTLFCQSVGRTDFPGADSNLIIKSIKDKLLNLADDTVVYPGHGPATTIGREKSSNPFLR